MSPFSRNGLRVGRFAPAVRYSRTAAPEFDTSANETCRQMTPYVRHGPDTIQAGASALSPLRAQGCVSPGWFGAGRANVAGDPASHAAVGFLAWRRDELLWRVDAALSPRRAVSGQDDAAADLRIHVEAHLGARSVASPVPGPHAGSRHRRFVLGHLPGRRDRAARASVGIPLEDVRDHAGRPVAVAIYEPAVFSIEKFPTNTWALEPKQVPPHSA